MRIIAGKHKSRRLKSVDSMKTRPTLDQVKESLFSRIGPYFEGGQFLDLFAGSGSMGLEALSRGMERVVFVDNSRQAIDTIKYNVESLNETKTTTILKMSYLQALSKLDSDGFLFDVIYCDPPYDFKHYPKMLEMVKPLLNENGFVLVEVEGKNQIEFGHELAIADVFEYRRATIYKLVMNVK